LARCGDLKASSRYIENVNPIVVFSAREHDISDDDILHAYRNPVRVLDVGDLVMLIGADRRGRLLEIGVTDAEGIDFIIHAMPARAKFLR
jgi:hypothetical protein